MQLLVTILQFFLSLSILVVIHEFGHFLFARLFKIRVEKFYIFFNPWFSLFKYKPKNSETTYGIGWLPLGGYVKIAGMIDESMDTEQMKRPVQDWEFRSKPAWQRFLVMIAGVTFNFLLAILIYSAISFHFGDKYIAIQDVKTGMEFSPAAQKAGFRDGDILLRADDTPLEAFDEEAFRAIINAEQVTVLRDGKEVSLNMPDDLMQQILQEKKGFANFRIPFVVDSVIAGSRAEMAGLKANDSIISVGDSVTAYMAHCIDVFAEHKNLNLDITVMRAGVPVQLQITPDHNGKIGVYMKRITDFYPVRTKKYSFWESIPNGIQRGVKKFTGYASDMKYVFTKEGAQSMGGFISIGRLFPYPFNAEIFWEMTAYLSVILAFMNLLPIPGLDGGHIMFVLYEMITRRKPSQKTLIRAQMIGMIFLFMLIIFANMNDVFRLFN